jgi:8-oxo-dGTP pyrophosphatase MutT (NUDIX family)
MSSNIKTAGGIVIKNEKILFIYKNGKWDLPKGRLEKGKNSRETSIIEISEETGLDKSELKIIKKLIPTYYHKKSGEKIITPLIPDLNENITECKWFSKNELFNVLEQSHERIRYLIEFFLNMPFYKEYINNIK